MTKSAPVRIAEPLIRKQGVQRCDFFRVALCGSQYILGAALKDIPQKLQASINISQTKLKYLLNKFEL